MRTSWATLLIVAALFGGCTFASVKPELMTAPPPQAPRILVIGDVRVADGGWDPYRPQFTRAVEKWLSEKQAFESVLLERPTMLPEGSIVLAGTITEVDKGSAALRWIVGMGAGQAKVKGNFEITDARGTALARFSTRESYLGGAGIGGAGFLDMNDLVRRFAESVAQTTVRYVRGEAIE
jgi:uncharacterized protein DUF4410